MNYKKIDCGLVTDVFNSMKYVETKLDIKGAIGDFLKHQTTEEMNELLTNVSKNYKWSELGNEERAELIHKFATEIEQAEDSFADLQRRVRNDGTGFLKKKALPYFVKTLRYYANLCQLVKIGQKGLVVCKLSEISSLPLLGYTLGPALSTGFNVLFVSSPLLGNLIEFIISSALRVGFPKDTISIVCEDNNLDLILKHATVIHCFDSIHRKFQNDKMLGVRPLMTPFVIFDNADLDSACEAIMNSIWKDQLLFNSLAKEVFVQETIYKEFVQKMKERINLSPYKVNNNSFSKTLKKLVSKAENNGVETFQSSDGFIMFYSGRVIDEDSCIAPCASITAFRNIDEAVALANNNIQGFSASIWTENIGIANYVAQNLNACNIWINTFGIYSPEVSFTTMKMSGKGYFGGIQGFQEMLYYNTEVMRFSGTKRSYDEKHLSDAITAAKKAQSKWKSLEMSVRISHFTNIIKFIENNRNKYKNDHISEEWLREWKLLFHQYLESNQYASVSSPYKEYNLNTSYSPKGVLVAEFTKFSVNHNKRLLIASILHGNCLVVLNQFDSLQEFYNQLSKLLPSGVLKIIPYSYGAGKTAVNNPDVDCYFNEYQIDEKLGLCDKFMYVSNCWSDVNNKVSYAKNVWSNVGQGFVN